MRAKFSEDLKNLNLKKKTKLFLFEKTKVHFKLYILFNTFVYYKS